MSNIKSLHWNWVVLPDLQRGCAALNDGIMSLSQECDTCHFIDYNPLLDQSMHLARDGLHVNRNGAYLLETALKSFVVDMDMVQITSAEKLFSSDMCRFLDTHMPYADVVRQFPSREKLKSTDYKEKTLVFSATNIRSLNQINALTSVRRLDNLTIDEEGNPVTKFTLWRQYTIFRLAHFALKKINDIEVSSSDIVNAEKLFGAEAHITTSQLPQSRLLSLLGETRQKQLHAMSEEKSRKVLDRSVKLDKAQGEFVGRAGLSYQTNESSANKESKKAFARSYINEITKEAIFTDRKRNELLKIWPQIFYEMVYSSLTDMSDLQGYMKKCMEELEKG